jgi:transcriptional regulator with XRE-family HTH domain/uncharacterized phage-associated protein
MKSPFTEGNANLLKERRVLEFRKEKFSILYHVWVCEETNEQFTTNEIDNLNLSQVHNKYREKYGIPFVDEIKEIREKYGLSAAKMSEVLGLGINVYRNYEAGEMPSVATGRLIRLAGDCEEFNKLLELSKNALELHEYDKVKKKIDQVISDCTIVEEPQELYLKKSKYPNIHNGYRIPKMVQFFAAENKPFLTGMNKLMFYADFSHFQNHGNSISGLRYKAIQRGPVPENYGAIYDFMINKEIVEIKEEGIGDYVGERFTAKKDLTIHQSEDLFSESEWNTIKAVSKRFKNLNTRQIVDISHKEPAWSDNVDDYHLISFEYGFGLKEGIEGVSLV